MDNVNNNPLISIVLPTKNRSYAIAPIMESLIAQTCNDFELIIVDNSDEGCYVDIEYIINEYQTVKVKYVRTGGLGLIENWEVAYASAKAEYVYLITDKLLLHPHTIQKFKEGITKFRNEDIFTFCKKSTGGKWVLGSTESLFNDTLDNLQNLLDVFYGSEFKVLISTRLRDEILLKYGKMIAYVGGDVDASIIALMSRANYCKINFIANGNKNFNIPSVGISGQYGGNYHLNYLTECNTSVKERTKFVPLDVENDWNCIYNDFFYIADIVGYSIDMSNFNKINYIIGVYIHTMYEYHFYHLDRSKEFLNIYNYLEEHNLLYNPKIRECMEMFIDSSLPLSYNSYLHKLQLKRDEEGKKNFYKKKYYGKRRTIELFWGKWRIHYKKK